MHPPTTAICHQVRDITVLHTGEIALNRPTLLNLVENGGCNFNNSNWWGPYRCSISGGLLNYARTRKCDPCRFISTVKCMGISEVLQSLMNYSQCHIQWWYRRNGTLNCFHQRREVAASVIKCDHYSASCGPCLNMTHPEIRILIRRICSKCIGRRPLTLMMINELCPPINQAHYPSK